VSHKRNEKKDQDIGGGYNKNAGKPGLQLVFSRRIKEQTKRSGESYEDIRRILMKGGLGSDGKQRTVRRQLSRGNLRGNAYVGKKGKKVAKKSCHTE